MSERLLPNYGFATSPVRAVGLGSVGAWHGMSASMCTSVSLQVSSFRLDRELMASWPWIEPTGYDGP
jgi:hypothetical protein